MKKMIVAAVAAIGLAGSFTSTASAAVPVKPCATTFALMDKYNIELGMHSEELEFVLGTVCNVTDNSELVVTRPTPCATVRFLMDKYNIEFGAYSPALEYVMGEVCGVTG